MADYQQPDGRQQRGRDYGPSSNYQRDAAFSNIFGAAPPPGRSQTMTSSVAPPEMMRSSQRTQTMSSTVSAMTDVSAGGGGGMQRPPPPRGGGGPGPGPGYYDDGRGPPPRPRPGPPPMDDRGGYYPNQRPMPDRHQGMSAQAQYMQQQRRPEGRPYPQQGPPPPHQQRFDPRGGPPPGGGPYGQGPRYHSVGGQGGGGPPPPGLNSDPYRSQSLATVPRQQMYHPPPNTYNQGPANAFRQQQQQQQQQQYGGGPVGPAGPPPPQQQPGPHPGGNPHSARTTAQGRVVPGRQDERSMSMTGYGTAYDRDAHQTMSGRVIPNRRAPSAGEVSGPNGIAAPNGGGGGGGYSNGYGGPAAVAAAAVGAYSPTGATGAPGTQTRTTSMASSTGGGVGNGSPTDSDGLGRTMSMASTVAPSVVAASDISDATTTLAHRPSVSKSIDSGERPPTAKIRPPLVYPALLSRVAECFRQKIITGERVKNELTYKNAFSGAEAVDVLSYIIRTTDRNLALLLGRALDAQKFFHDVTYEHRLRDSTTEMYQFRESLMDEPEDKPPVDGVFVLLSECYSPTCTRDQLCYSIACPRRLEQVQRQNRHNAPPGVTQRVENVTIDDDADQTDEQKLWINSVPREVADSVGDREKKRQEVISEICYTERDFVKDLEYLRDFWIMPLRSNASPIPQNRRGRVVRTIFSNIVEPPSLHNVSSRFAKALTDRQQKSPVVHNIGDVFLEFAPHFEPFIFYGSKQLEGKFEFENERSINPFFSRFVDEIERRKESRKLELNGYLTKPTTRLARYPLLLENVLKYTEDPNPDKEDIPKVLIMIRSLLTKVNAESGKAENRFNLRRLHEQLRFRPNEKVDLKLTDDGRELVFKSQLKKSPTEANEITAFLFDHAVLLVRIKQAGKAEEVKAYRRPIPLELLSIKEMDEVIPQQGTVKRSSSSLIPSIRSNTTANKQVEGWPITFRHLGKLGYELTLYASNQAGRKKWLEFIDQAQQRLRARADFFNTTTISSNFFTATNQVNCVAPFDGGRKLIYGTDNGIYVSDRKVKDQPRRVLEAQNVTQIDVLDQYQLLLVLSNKSLLSYSLSALDPNEPALSKRPKKIQSHCNFFKTGICLGRQLVCCVKSSALSTTIKVYEPNDAMSKTKKQHALGKMFNASQDELKPFKEFYIPTESSSVHFLKSKLCVACARGFEVVSLETLETQSLLDQADTSLDFVARKEGVKPIHIERLNGEFLLNYSEFSFFVNRNGWRARPDWRIEWEGSPQSFALSYPWILAFEPNFIELRNIESGAVHIVPHKNIRMLHSSTHEILFAYEDERGEDVVESIDFWKNNRKSELPPLPTSERSASSAPPPPPQQGASQHPHMRHRDMLI